MLDDQTAIDKLRDDAAGCGRVALVIDMPSSAAQFDIQASGRARRARVGPEPLGPKLSRLLEVIGNEGSRHERRWWSCGDNAGPNSSRTWTSCTRTGRAPLVASQLVCLGRLSCFVGRCPSPWNHGEDDEPRSSPLESAVPLDTTHTYRVAVIGAGPGGICTAVRLRQAGIEDFVVFERADGIGGTWRRNRYPGLACDIASHFYSFSFAPKPDWSRPFAGQAEILSYLEEVVSAFEIRPHIHLGTSVDAAHWDEETARWRLTTGDGTTVTAETVVAGPGMFGELRFPEIEGMERFRGASFHTGSWPAGHSLSGERVAIVGSAASAVQLLPEAAEVARRVHLFQRSATWVLPKEDVPFTSEQLEQFVRSPASVAELRAALFRLYATDPPFAAPAQNAERERLAVASIAVVEDPEVRARLTPTTPWGCHRPLFSNDYYPTFNRPNVELVTEPIERITSSGVLTADGTEREVDTIVYATGYETTRFASVIDFVGRDRVRLQDAWAEGAHAYLGITTSGFPNLFMLYGPNTNAGSIIYMIECQVDYVVRLLQRMEHEDLAWIDVHPDVMAAYNRQLQLDIEQVEVWQGGCSTYYRVPSGRIVTQWPHSMDRYRELTDTPHPLDAYETHAHPRP